MLNRLLLLLGILLLPMTARRRSKLRSIKPSPASTARRKRDQYRHPKETLLFGLRPDMIGESDRMTLKFVKPK